ncbi:MAG: adaptor protein MecA [Oscillospiraceae bacterium]
MEVQTINSRTFSIYITETELSRRSLEPCDVTAAQARDIVRSALGAESGSLFMELFPGRHELLIFVRKNFLEVGFYSFATAEDVIDALLSCCADIAASLFYYNDEYILVVWSLSESADGALSEFGTPLQHPPGYLAHLNEHGRCLADGCALSAIKNAFKCG